MKLLIVTQAVDTEDPVLGFFVHWIEEFSKHVERIEAICLREGKHALPANVRVHSLGKEQGSVSRIAYAWRFLSLAWRLRDDYDTVFVHMNQEYILIAGWLWKLQGKSVFMWRNHPKGNFLTRAAVILSDRVFCTSPRSFTARFKKTELMPVGIDTNFFRPSVAVLKKPSSILFLGRIAPIKNVAVFVDALNELQLRNVAFTATIAGAALTADAGYEEMIKNKVIKYGLTGRVQFVGPVVQDEALRLYQEHECYVNLTPPGSMDKTIFEAMACGVTPVVYNDGLRHALGERYVVKDLDAKNIARALEDVLSGERRDFRDYVVEQHSLQLLVRNVLAK